MLCKGPFGEGEDPRPCRYPVAGVGVGGRRGALGTAHRLTMNGGRWRVYTGGDGWRQGAGVTANLNSRGASRRSGRRSLSEGTGLGVLSYVLVTAVFVIVLIVVITSLGTSIGEGLQDLVDQIPISL